MRTYQEYKDEVHKQLEAADRDTDVWVKRVTTQENGGVLSASFSYAKFREFLESFLLRDFDILVGDVTRVLKDQERKMRRRLAELHTGELDKKPLRLLSDLVVQFHELYSK